MQDKPATPDEDDLPLLRGRLRRARDPSPRTGQVTSRGDPDHPANFGRLCSKGMALGETMGLDGRLLAPEIGGR
jgi:anaerobic selenocysteine-containing dehydrogenase